MPQCPRKPPVTVPGARRSAVADIGGRRRSRRYPGRTRGTGFCASSSGQFPGQGRQDGFEAAGQPRRQPARHHRRPVARQSRRQTTRQSRRQTTGQPRGQAEGGPGRTARRRSALPGRLTVRRVVVPRSHQDHGEDDSRRDEHGQCREQRTPAPSRNSGRAWSLTWFRRRLWRRRRLLVECTRLVGVGSYDRVTVVGSGSCRWERAVDAGSSRWERAGGTGFSWRGRVVDAGFPRRGRVVGTGLAGWRRVVAVGRWSESAVRGRHVTRRARGSRRYGRQGHTDQSDGARHTPRPPHGSRYGLMPWST